MQDLLSFYWNNTEDEEKEGRGERELGGRADQLEGPFWSFIKASLRLASFCNPPALVGLMMFVYPRKHRKPGWFVFSPALVMPQKPRDSYWPCEPAYPRLSQ